MSKSGKICKYSGIGGQAVLEGIMMRNGGKYAIAVRKQDGEIEVRTEPYKSVINAPSLQKIPIVRGFVNFIDSLVIGIRCLMYSASFFEEEPDPAEQKKKEQEGSKDPAKKEKEDKLFMAGTLTFAIGMSIVLFMAVPFLLSRFIGAHIQSAFAKSLLEALIRVGVFLTYMIAISRMKDIQRTFAYHGAEHKCINCIENGRELTVDNVLISSRLHKRCGTSFLFFVIMVSVIFQMFIFADSRLMQILIRLLLIPVIAGVSYEIIRLAGTSESRLVAILSKPGMALQKLTTREPDASQAEVAIRAVEAVFDWRAFLKGNTPGESGEKTAENDGI